MARDNKKEKKTFFDRMLDSIEYAGNKLPDPIVLFFMLCGIILAASFIAGLFKVSATHPVTGETVVANNLLDGAGIVDILTKMVTNFSEFPPLGMVLVMMIGVGLAEQSGFFDTLMKRSVIATPKKIIIPSIILIAIVGNVAADATQVVLPPIAATVLMAFGFHPMVGLIVAYASTTGAFSANLMIGMTDTLAAGFTESGAQTVDPNYQANPAMNYYFIAVSTFFLLAVSTWVTYKFTIPRFGSYTGEIETVTTVTSEESRGLKWAGISVAVFLVAVLAMILPENGILRNPETGSIIEGSPLMNGIVPLLTIFFLLPGLFYGLGAGTVKSSKDFGEMTGKAMSTMGPYIVLVFASAQFLAYFSASNLGPIIAIKGADFLESVGFTGIPLFIVFILFVSLINILIGSASAKWAILAPIFVPMFMFLDYHPAFTQALYRIGDSISNPITPMLPYLVLLLSFAKKYDKNMGLGTLISALFPYTIFFGIFWIILIVVWYLLGIPVGPEGPIHL
ncbi:AbgT family transporter [Bacillus sp. ISL-47]|uniref:AbgT family transporter n=1 Tax=Bacillus sp. ISL-47 TaxID=2819130 RepID=UPI001BE6A66D|nr:AbgT family transporter [Bacillus sp. ISL-47]MBT2686911.1 AbgT family transporter [Bacillus sp. ISL-47]MBT2710451.1 AbgT family transporter [Pseudomonas sp. ISL-84]